MKGRKERKELPDKEGQKNFHRKEHFMKSMQFLHSCSQKKMILKCFWGYLWLKKYEIDS